MSLPRLLSRADIKARLLEIFPEGTPQRGYCVRDISAATIYAALYVGAVGNAKDAGYAGPLFGPKFVYRMTDDQASATDDDARTTYAAAVVRGGYRGIGQQWYADNSRESIRDETLREGLIALGAVSEKDDVPTTSANPRYALVPSFASLFDPALTGQALSTAIKAWQQEYLGKATLARTALLRAGAGKGDAQLLVAFPNGETRRMKAGPSSEITKHVIEVFAPRYLADPAVLLISESGRKLISHDEERMALIGLKISIDKDLPDIILADLGPATPRIIFVEVVATDGPISTRRRDALAKIVEKAGLPADCAVFVTAYSDRSSSAFKKTVPELAWGTHAWFASEPHQLVSLRSGDEGPISIYS